MEDSNKEGHTIVLRTTPEKTEKALRTERQTFPQRVAGRLPDSVMPLKTQLMASEEQKRLAFTAFCKSSNRYSGYTTKQNSPVYLLDSTSYPFQKVDSVTRDNDRHNFGDTVLSIPGLGAGATYQQAEFRPETSVVETSTFEVCTS